MTKEYLIRNQSFQKGFTSLTIIGEAQNDTGINFGILKLQAGETQVYNTNLETAILLMHGKCRFDFSQTQKTVERLSLFDEDPYALHFAANHQVTITALTDCEFSISQVLNDKQFETMFFDSTNMLESEPRGKGLLNDTSYRIVRTIFDIRNRPDAKLVLGEVITAPGRWSSYPPHHHPQPEIYHYRFTENQGFGISQCGEEYFQIQQNDTYKILNQNNHAQVAAPGYGMYYIWVIRHLENVPYTVPEFEEKHNWTRTPDANQRVWKGF